MRYSIVIVPFIIDFVQKVIELNDIEHIKNYILYLKNECGLSVSLHVDEIDNIIIPSELRLFNIHDNPYCAMIKRSSAARVHCVKNQKEVLKKCANGNFCGMCYAGVKEFVYPIKKANHTIAFISVGGYRTDIPDSYLAKVSNKFGIDKGELIGSYSLLKSYIPHQKYIDTLIFPLQAMLELMYQKTEPIADLTPDFLTSIVNYINKNYTQDISSKDICRHFYCSRSKFSHIFNDKMGISISSYINNLRCEAAKELLKNSELSVTDIAFSVGYKDSNYFTYIFKKNIGVSPSLFRKNIKSV